MNMSCMEMSSDIHRHASAFNIIDKMRAATQNFLYTRTIQRVRGESIRASMSFGMVWRVALLMEVVKCER
jgi:hypothetical protein